MVTKVQTAKKSATKANNNTFPLMPTAIPNFKIPKKSKLFDENKLCERLDRMEALMNKHMEKSKEFKDTMKSANEQLKEEVMHALSFDGQEHTQHSQLCGEEVLHDVHP